MNWKHNYKAASSARSRAPAGGGDELAGHGGRREQVGGHAERVAGEAGVLLHGNQSKFS